MTRKGYIVHIRVDYEAWSKWKELLTKARISGKDANWLFKKMMYVYERLYSVEAP